MGDVRVAALAQLTTVALLGEVVSALQQPRVDLRVRAAVDGEQRLEHRPYRGLARGGDQAAGEAIADPAAMLLTLRFLVGNLGQGRGGEHRRGAVVGGGRN